MESMELMMESMELTMESSVKLLINCCLSIIIIIIIVVIIIIIKDSLSYEISDSRLLMDCGMLLIMRRVWLDFLLM